mmetsp:Transcript_3037/g.4734  ORF Transcript_3037/g.4734 Transcript_3037/m.4734 type:complete len:379 (+) Transcript_3037:88-1224(+)
MFSSYIRAVKFGTQYPMYACMILTLLLVAYWTPLVISTTIVAAKCADGIVIASDSQSSTGSMVSNRMSRKMFLLSPSTAICACDGNGGHNSDSNEGRVGADFQCLYSDLHDIMVNYETNFGTTMSTSTVARVARQLMSRRYRRAHVIVAGWDENRRMKKSAPQSEAFLSHTAEHLKFAKKKVVNIVRINGGVRNSVESTAEYTGERTDTGQEASADVLLQSMELDDVDKYMDEIEEVVEVDAYSDDGGEVDNDDDLVEYVLCEILPGGSRVDQDVVVAGTGASLAASVLLQPSASSSSSSSSTLPSSSSSTLLASSHSSSQSKHIPQSIVGASHTGSTCTTRTVSQAIERVRRGLMLAANLDPFTGSDQLGTMWILQR